jgi:RNA polymerase sigma-70 factor (ECF subfamily)
VHTNPDADVWQAWLDAHAARLLLYARQQTRTEADAEDVLQDALVESWERAAGQPPPLPLVFTTIRRRAIDLARGNDRRAAREQPDEPLAPWFDPDPAGHEAQQLLADAVKQLPEPQREVLTLKVWGGLTFQQIADATGTPANTVASRYRYALDALRQTFTQLFR